MNLRQLEYLVAVADAGSFSRAAEALFVTQPSLSEGIARLEREFGVTLVRRDVRPVALTDDGRLVVSQARRALRDVERIREAVTDVAELRGGTLRIAAPGLASAEPLARWIASFSRAHPRVHVRVESPAEIEEVAAQVADARCDLGITYRDVPRALTIAHEETVEFVVVCPPGTELPAPPVPLAEVPGPMIVPTDLSTAAPEVRSVDLHPADVEVAIVARLRELIVPLVLSGAGTTLMPEGLARGAQVQGAVTAPLAPPVTLPLRLVHRAGDLSPAAAAFLDHVG